MRINTAKNRFLIQAQIKRLYPTDKQSNVRDDNICNGARTHSNSCSKQKIHLYVEAVMSWSNKCSQNKIKEFCRKKISE
jgi:hypothetical protein